MKYSFVAIILSIIFFTSCQKKYHVERTIEINASKEIVWEQVKYFKNWSKWSPWYKSDSTIRYSYGGEDGNVESFYAWESEEYGAGNILNTGFTEDEEIMFRATFIEPGQYQANGHITVTETPEGKTKVKWVFNGVNKGISALFLQMDDLLGSKFEEGLTLLKEYTEQLEKEKPQEKINIIDFDGQNYVAIRQLLDIASLQNFYSTSFQKIQDLGIKLQNGNPSGIYYTWDMQEMKSDMAAAFPVENDVIAPEETSLIQLPAGKAMVYNYYGDYKHIGKAHELMNTYIANQQLVYKGPAIEEFIIGPADEVNPEKWHTKIIYLLQ